MRVSRHRVPGVGAEEEAVSMKNRCSKGELSIESESFALKPLVWIAAVSCGQNVSPVDTTGEWLIYLVMAVLTEQAKGPRKDELKEQLEEQQKAPRKARIKEKKRNKLH